ncbi:hypothetical protein SC09_contig11orf00010 [Bacillus subtilis]|uniref:Uncharacterized protein n=1 Tax=Bacillus subtilis TaxID=1423 RepID=A0A0D1KUA6_BACIU|nr:hypothetical protein SC09_contig11orf00005 [Bacillus subtilis]KIU09822.1 hypothetical protein SC09_contig11orf00010 [Bacillus subtilis]
MSLFRNLGADYTHQIFGAVHDKLLQGLLIKKEVCSNARD